MPRFLWVFSVSLLLVGCPTTADDDSGGSDVDEVEDDFGSRVAGSYFLEVRHDGFPDISGLVHLTRDGGFMGSDMSDFGARDLSSLNSPIYGSWVKTGDTSFKTRTLYFGYDATGEPIAITRTTGDVVFADDTLATGDGEMFIELFDPSQDPLDEAEEPFDTLDGSVTARRIVVP